MKTTRLNLNFIKHKMVDLDITSQIDLALNLDLPESTIAGWFRKESTKKSKIPSPKNLAKLIELLNCDFNDLLEIVEVQNET